MAAHSRVRPSSDVLNVFATPDSEYDDSGSDSDDGEQESCHESEQDASSEEDWLGESKAEFLTKQQNSLQSQQNQESLLHSENGYVWFKNLPETRVKLEVNRETGGPKGRALDIETPLEAWSLLFTDEILNIIVTRTNEQIMRAIEAIKEYGGTIGSQHKLTDLVETKAVIGLLYFAGMHKLSGINTRNLWSPYGMALFRLTMPQQRFHFLLLSLTFDEKNTRRERRSCDRLANIRVVWDMFIKNCTANYEPHVNCTIGKLFFPFRGKCSFGTHTQGHSSKYGLKIVMLNDSTTHYMQNAIPYVSGIVKKDSSEPIASYYVRKITEPIHHSGRNVTCDKRFTSVPLFDKITNDYGLTMVGSLDKNQPEIPKKFKILLPASTNFQFAYHDEKILISYNPKANKIVLLLSSLHKKFEIDPGTGKPDIVVFYDNTKSGTEGFDKKCREYSTARKTKRWATRYFYGMLDQANVNSLILYASCENNVQLNRENFILELSLALVKPLLVRRLTIPSLRITLRVQIEAIVNHNNNPSDEGPCDLMANNKMEKPKRCSFCRLNADRKSYYKCLRCQRIMCREHMAKVCFDCSIDMAK